MVKKKKEEEEEEEEGEEWELVSTVIEILKKQGRARKLIAQLPP